jgi:hypothetical protein
MQEIKECPVRAAHLSFAVLSDLLLRRRDSTPQPNPCADNFAKSFVRDTDHLKSRWLWIVVTVLLRKVDLPAHQPPPSVDQ